MTDGDSTPGTVRDAAREQAKALRALHRRRDRQRRWLLRIGLVAVVLLVIVAVTVVLLFLRTPPQPGPLNMPSDGIRIGAGAIAERGSAVAAESTPTPFPSNPPGVLDIRVYVDYLSEDSAAFQRDNGEVIRAWLDAGTATVEIHPVALLTTQSSGTRYSLRAAAAAGCVAQYAPDSFLDFHAGLLEARPADGGEGLGDAEIFEVAATALAGPALSDSAPTSEGEQSLDASALPQMSLAVDPLQRIEGCIRDERFRPWTLAATDRATGGPLPGTELEALTAAPTILVNGIPFDYDVDGDVNEFRMFVLRVTGNEYIERSTPAPTPGPSEVPEGE